MLDNLLVCPAGRRFVPDALFIFRIIPSMHCIVKSLRKNIFRIRLKGMIGLDKKTKASPAKIKANNKYRDKTYDPVQIWIKKGKRDELKAVATSHGQSLNSYIIEAIKDKLKKDGHDVEIF